MTAPVGAVPTYLPPASPFAAPAPLDAAPLDATPLDAPPIDATPSDPPAVQPGDQLPLFAGAPVRAPRPPRSLDSLSAEASLLETLLASAPMGFAFFDTDGRYLRLNDQLASAEGTTEAEYLGTFVTEGTGPLTPVLVEGFEETLGLGTPVLGREVAVVGPQGPQQWVTTWYPTFSPSKELMGVAVFASDVAELTTLEAELRRSEERYRLLVEATALDVFRVDAHGEWLQDLPGVRARLGAPEPWLGLDWLDYVHPADAPSLRAAWQEAASAGTAFEAEFRMLGPTAAQLHIAMRLIPVLTRGSALAGMTREWVGQVQDVTAERLLLRRTLSLQAVTRELAGALTAREVAGALTSVLCAELGAPAAIAAAYASSGELELLSVEGYPPALFAPFARVPREHDGLMAACARLEGNAFVSSPDELKTLVAPGPLLDGLLDHGAQSWAVVALSAAGSSQGSLGLSFTERRAFDDAEREFLLALASQGAQALQRAALFEQQSNAARELQKALLPGTLPTWPGLELAASYQTAAGADVGGDWYDAFEVGGRVALVLGDVMGRGLRAASIMGQLKNAMRALIGLDPAPASVLTGMDAFMQFYEDDEIVTLAYLLLDPRTGKGILANAGHLPPMLVRASGGVERLDTHSGGLLGLPGDRSEVLTFVLHPGDALVVYSDGLVERKGWDLDAGMDGLAAVLGTLAGVPTLAELVRVVLGTVGEGADDDTSMLVARRPLETP